MNTRFADDPVAGHSAQFPLARPFGARLNGADVPSPAGVRPWNLRCLTPQSPQDASLPRDWTYDHVRQVAVDSDGEPLIIHDASAKSVSNNDGDEGPSEDWQYDFAGGRPRGGGLIMAVLILTRDLDPSADHVVGALAERGVEVHRINTAWFPTRLSVTAALRRGRWTGALRTSHRVVDLESVDAVWYRAPETYLFPPELTATERQHAAMEAKYGLGGVLASLPALWVNHPSRMADVAYKPTQLVWAARCGLAVPDTVITNEADSAAAFARSGQTVTKLIGASTIIEEGRRKIGYTRAVDPLSLQDLRGVEQTAHLFQRWVPKAFEVRLIVIGDRLTSAAITAGTDDTYVDFRLDYDVNDYRLIDTPEPVAAGVRAFMAQAGLVYAAWDFVVTPDNEWVFLEINAGGQYGFVEQRTGAPLTAQLADLLAGGSSA